jgi:hypothetical protein
LGRSSVVLLSLTLTLYRVAQFERGNRLRGETAMARQWEQAEEQAIEAIAFTLENANEATSPAESEVSYLCLTMQRSPHEHPATAHR